MGESAKIPPTISGNLIVCSQVIPVDVRIANFVDNPAFDSSVQGIPPTEPAEGLANVTKRYASRSLMHGGKDLGRLQEIIRQVVLHHDGLGSAKDCFHVLYDQRGLSAHFLLDNDGTLYQTLDLMHLAYHAGGVNPISIGIEICNRGKWLEDERDYYSKKHRARDTEDVKIHGHSYKMWQFTDEQYDTLIALGRALQHLFPNLPPHFPSEGRSLIQTVISEPREFSGYLGHFHVTRDKWDPGCLNFQRICQNIQGSPSWFLLPGATTATIDNDGAEQEKELLNNNANEAMGGYFPVGPCGADLVWHGGVHFHVESGTPLFAPIGGNILAARQGDPAPIGSTNFVLTKHRLPFVSGAAGAADKPLYFYLLLYHVEFGPTLPWRKRRKGPLPAGQVVYPKIPCTAGEILAYAGRAGPPGNLEDQVHVEIFSIEDLSAALWPANKDQKSPLRLVSATTRSSRCTEREILAPLEEARTKTPGQFPRLREKFGRDPIKDDLPWIVAEFQSEWVLSSAREQEIRRETLRGVVDGERIWKEQIRPTLWWSKEVAEQLGLPADGVVWHYHPVRFLSLLNQAIRRGATGTTASADRSTASASQATDGALGQVAFLDEEDRMMADTADLQLPDLVEGWPDPE